MNNNARLSNVIWLVENKYYYYPNTVLGRGGQAEVFLGERIKEDGTTEKIAVKRLKESTSGIRAQEEIQILRKISHINIIKMIDFLQFKVGKKIQYYLILEYCGRGSIDKYLKHLKGNESHIRKLIIQIVQALQVMRANDVIHRDLKPSNMLLDQNNQIKVIDFGLAKIVDTQETKTVCGTIDYMPPEILTNPRGSTYNTSKVDIFSLGIILYEFMFSETPWKNIPQVTKKQKMTIFYSNQLNQIGLPKSPHYSELCYDFLARCLVINLENRISFVEMIRHPWLTQPTRTSSGDVNNNIRNNSNNNINVNNNSSSNNSNSSNSNSNNINNYINIDNNAGSFHNNNNNIRNIINDNNNHHLNNNNNDQHPRNVININIKGNDYVSSLKRSKKDKMTIKLRKDIYIQALLADFHKITSRNYSGCAWVYGKDQLLKDSSSSASWYWFNKAETWVSKYVTPFGYFVLQSNNSNYRIIGVYEDMSYLFINFQNHYDYALIVFKEFYDLEEKFGKQTHTLFSLLGTKL